MKITRLSAENIKRIIAVDIKPDGTLVQITGRNAQGKSTVLDSIAMALGGKAQVCEQPIRRGASKGKIVCELDDLIVTRSFTEGGGGSLTVTSRAGAKYPSPQAMLDKLYGPISFDPLAFTRMDGRRQLDTLKALIGLDFTAVDAERAELYARRTVLNRDVKAVETMLAAYAEHPDTPDAEVSVSELMAELDAIRSANDAIDQLAAERDRLHKVAADAVERVKLIERQLEEARKAEANAVMAFTRARDAVEGKARIDPDPVVQKINTADAVNTRVRQNKVRQETEAKLQSLTQDAEQLTRDIESIDKEKAEKLAAAAFPVPGLSFDETGVLFSGLPLSQASSAEQLRVSVAIGLAMNRDLRVLLIRDGSLLDSDGLALVAEMAAQADAQVWIERVADGDPVGIVIEDGMVAAVVTDPSEETQPVVV